jgi:hypothetical protein
VHLTCAILNASILLPQTRRWWSAISGATYLPQAAPGTRRLGAANAAL